MVGRRDEAAPAGGGGAAAGPAGGGGAAACAGASMQSAVLVFSLPGGNHCRHRASMPPPQPPSEAHHRGLNSRRFDDRKGQAEPDEIEFRLPPAVYLPPPTCLRLQQSMSFGSRNARRPTRVSRATRGPKIAGWPGGSNLAVSLLVMRSRELTWPARRATSTSRPAGVACSRRSQERVAAN